MSFAIFEEVEPHYLVKVGVHLVHIVKVKAIVEFCKFEYHIDHLGLVRTVEAPVLFPVKNAFATLINQVGTYRVLGVVKCFVPLLLFGQQYHCAVVFGLALVIVKNCVSDVTPNVGGVVSVQINYALLLSFHNFTANSASANILAILSISPQLLWFSFVAECRNLIEVVLVSLAPNNVNNFVERSFWVDGRVCVCVVSKNFVVGDLAEGD